MAHGLYNIMVDPHTPSFPLEILPKVSTKLFKPITTQK